MSQLTAKLKKSKRLGGFKERPDMADEDLTLDYIFDNVIIRGSVNRVVDGILALHEKIGDSARCSIAARTGPIRRCRENPWS